MAGDYPTTTPDGNAVKTQRVTLPMSEATSRRAGRQAFAPMEPKVCPSACADARNEAPECPRLACRALPFTSACGMHAGLQTALQGHPRGGLCASLFASRRACARASLHASANAPLCASVCASLRVVPHASPCACQRGAHGEASGDAFRQAQADALGDAQSGSPAEASLHYPFISETWQCHGWHYASKMARPVHPRRSGALPFYWGHKVSPFSAS